MLDFDKGVKRQYTRILPLQRRARDRDLLVSRRLRAHEFIPRHRELVLDHVAQVHQIVQALFQHLVGVDPVYSTCGLAHTAREDAECHRIRKEGEGKRKDGPYV